MKPINIHTIGEPETKMCISASSHTDTALLKSEDMREEIQSQLNVINLVNILSRFRNGTIYTEITSKFSRLASCFGGLRAILGSPDSNNDKVKIFGRHRWAACEANKQEVELE